MTKKIYLGGKTDFFAFLTLSSRAHSLSPSQSQSLSHSLSVAFHSIFLGIFKIAVRPRPSPLTVPSFSQDASGRSPLAQAARQGHEKFVRLCVDYEAEIDLKVRQEQ